MAKHAHKIALIENKVWRCTLPNCSWFVYTGQQWIIENKHIECWKCGESFMAAKHSLRDEMPICDECRIPLVGKKEEIDAEKFIKHIASMNNQKDEIEINEPDDIPTDHTPSCAAYFDPNDTCTCGYR